MENDGERKGQGRKGYRTFELSVRNPMADRLSPVLSSSPRIVTLHQVTSVPTPNCLEISKQVFVYKMPSKHGHFYQRSWFAVHFTLW